MSRKVERKIEESGIRCQEFSVSRREKTAAKNAAEQLNKMRIENYPLKGELNENNLREMVEIEAR